MLSLDCVVIGYKEDDFNNYQLMCEQSGPDSPEWQIFRKEHLVIGGRAMPWMDALSALRNRMNGRDDRYHVGEVFNLASLYLVSFLRKHGLHAEGVSLFDAERSKLADLLADRPAVVAVTTTFYVNILPVIPVVEFVRDYAPDSHIVVGGPLVDNLCADGMTDEVQDLLHGMGADSYVHESQGEATLARLCRVVAEGGSLESIPNLIVPRDGLWSANTRRPEANDLDTCAIDWSGFKPHEIGATAQTRTARSCAFKCSFCDYPTRAGALTTASVETVRQELRALAQLGVRNLVFVDDTFNVPPKRFKALCKMMIEEDLGISWYSYFRCSNARDEETFDLAAASGCRGVFLGIESGDPTILANMNKLAQDSQYRSGIARLHERGIKTFASIIVGFPGESEGTMRNTIDFIRETRPTFWRAQPWWANPRSPVYGSRDVYGIKGAAYNWSHLTMDSTEAAAWCDTMFDEITESVWLPLYDFDFWSLPYLDGKGLSIDQLIPLLSLSQSLMRERDSGSTDSARVAKLNDELAAGIAALDMVPARFTGA